MSSEDEKQSELGIILAQWEVCTGLANAFSTRRDLYNNLFVTIDVALIAGISIFTETKTILLSVAGMMISVIWILNIRYYRSVSKAKYKVILNLEKELPKAPFHDEWEQYKSKRMFIEGTHIEMILPVLFVIVFISVLFFCQ